ncbi:hypothetical protein [Kiloniella antarctica]|uniref:Solute-binding protein family 3/N-terminal domain-containing protein n=1 Tax=Kiloniella antarctica TaxID=1550907 RepID=A0ABW5BRL0_9PROT
MLFAIGRFGKAYCTLLLFFFSVEQALAGSVRDSIEDRGYLRCGIEKTTSFLSENPPLENAAREYCEAITLALFRDKNANKVIYIPPGKTESFLNNNSVDLVMLSGSRGDVSHQITVLSAPLLINDVKVLNLTGGKAPQRLSGQRVCTLNNQINNQGLAVFGQKKQTSFSVASYKTPDDLLEMALNHKCRAVALPRIQLLQFHGKIQKYYPLAEIIDSATTNPKLGIVVLASDPEWINVTSAFGYALLEAEIQNINSTNIDYIASTSTNKAVQLLLGLKEDQAVSLGLDKQWAYRVLKSYGNYGEIYERHFGVDSDFPIARNPISFLLNEPVYNQSVLKRN